MEWVEILKVLGPQDGLMGIAIFMIWREWRKAEAKSLSLLESQVTMTSETIAKYSSFEGAIRGLTEVIKKG